MSSYLDTFLSLHCSESLNNTKLSKAVTALAKLSLYQDEEFLCDIFIQKPKISFGRSPTNKNITDDELTMHHVSNCNGVAENHFKIEFESETGFFVVIPKMLIHINEQPYICNELLFNEDVIKIQCKSHSHSFVFCLPKNGENNLSFQNISPILSSPNFKFGKMLSFWSKSDVDSFLVSLKCLGVFKPFAVRAHSQLKNKSVIDIHLASIQFCLILYNILCDKQNTAHYNSNELNSDFRINILGLLSDLVKSENFAVLSDLAQSNFPKAVEEIPLPDPFGWAKSICHNLFVYETVCSEKVESRHIESRVKCLPLYNGGNSVRWDAKDDRALLCELYKKGLSSFGEMALCSSFKDKGVTAEALEERFNVIFEHKLKMFGEKGLL